MSDPAFDRVRPRAAGSGASARAAAPGARRGDEPRGIDIQGKSALFSAETVNPSLGTVAITCSGCHVATRTSYLRALRCALPSLHLVVLRRDYPSWMRCPACGERRWVHVRFR